MTMSKLKSSDSKRPYISSAIAKKVKDDQRRPLSLKIQTNIRDIYKINKSTILQKYITQKMNE